MAKRGRKKGSKLSQEHKRKISQAMRKKHREWKKYGRWEKDKEKRMSWPDPDMLYRRKTDPVFEDFQEGDSERKLVRFLNVPAVVIVNGKASSIGIEVAGISIEQGNFENKIMKEIISRLSGKYKGEMRSTAIRKRKKATPHSTRKKGGIHSKSTVLGRDGEV